MLNSLFEKLQLASNDFANLSKGVQVEIRRLLEDQLKQHNLVTRDEFEVQQQVLKKTRELVEKLQEQLDQIEAQNQSNKLP